MNDSHPHHSIPAPRWRYSVLAFAAVAVLLLLVGTLHSADPTPAATAADWQANAHTAAAANISQASATAATGTVDWTGWALAIGGAIIAIGKFLPGVGGPVAQVLDLIYKALVAKHVTDAENKQAALASGMETTMHLIEQLGGEATLSDLKSKLASRLPSGALDAVNEWLKQREQTGLPIKSTPLIAVADNLKA